MKSCSFFRLSSCKVRSLFSESIPLRKRPRNVRFDLVYLIENRERLILEDGICVKNKKPGFHNCKASVEQEPRRNQGKRPPALTSANLFLEAARHSHSARSR